MKNNDDDIKTICNDGREDKITTPGSSIAAKLETSDSKRQARKAKKRETDREWRKRNPERKKELDRKWKSQNLTQRLEYNKRWKDAHREHLNALARIRSKLHIEEHRARGRKYSKEHKAERAEYNHKWYRRNKERAAKNRKQWRKQHPDKVLAYAHADRIKRLSAPSSEDAKLAIRIIKKKHSGICFYCGRQRKLTIEHIKPVARGGHHSAFNIVAACKACNLTKKHTPANEFITNGQLVLVF